MKTSTERTENGFHKNPLCYRLRRDRRERWERLHDDGEMRKGRLKFSPLR